MLRKSVYGAVGLVAISAGVVLFWPGVPGFGEATFTDGGWLRVLYFENGFVISVEKHPGKWMKLKTEWSSPVQEPDESPSPRGEAENP